MSWIAITTEMLKERKVAPLIDAAADYAAGLTPPQEDPTPALIASAVDDIRTAVRSCRSNALDADADTIPGNLVDLACRMVTFALKNYLELDLTQDERDNRAADRRTLERVASCDLAVAATDNPETTSTVQAGASAPRMNTVTRTFTRAQQDGI